MEHPLHRLPCSVDREAVCADVDAYFAPDDNCTAAFRGRRLLGKSTPVKGVVVESLGKLNEYAVVAEFSEIVDWSHDVEPSSNSRLPHTISNYDLIRSSLENMHEFVLNQTAESSSS